MMSEEQLRRSLQEISGELEGLSSLERPLTKEEGKHRKKLQLRKYVIDRIKEAKDKDQKSDELYNTTYYQMLVPSSSGCASSGRGGGVSRHILMEMRGRGKRRNRYCFRNY
jgi:hypothetical protein